ncbi:hypothetical protein DRJ48_03170 [Candidatus Woesearchaeota archaeon]|nr:MAG: hypothetical protein DRJ48_03170 [Candidatus Woesearchaeota archaeon]
MSNNIAVNREGVTLKLNKDIYLKKAVLLACEAFGEGCWVNLSIQDGAYRVVLTPKQRGLNLEKLGYEFFNYVLGIMQNV